MNEINAAFKLNGNSISLHSKTVLHLYSGLNKRRYDTGCTSDVSEGFQLFTTLQRLKIPSKMFYFANEVDWVLKPQNSRLSCKIEDWAD